MSLSDLPRELLLRVAGDRAGASALARCCSSTRRAILSGWPGTRRLDADADMEAFDREMASRAPSVATRVRAHGSDAASAIAAVSRHPHVVELTVTTRAPDVDASRLASLPRLARLGFRARDVSGLCALDRLRDLRLSGGVGRLPACLPPCLTRLETAGIKRVASALPPTLRALVCRGATSLPARLPPSLLLLDCGGSPELRRVGARLPATLTHLKCRGCDALRCLPLELPPALRALDCRDCESLARMPLVWPRAMDALDVRGCPILEERGWRAPVTCAIKSARFDGWPSSRPS